MENQKTDLDTLLATKLAGLDKQLLLKLLDSLIEEQGIETTNAKE